MKYELLGIIILPGMQWSKYLLINEFKEKKLVYESELHKLCIMDRVLNCESILPEKKSYDDYTNSRVLKTHPADLLEKKFVRVTMVDWVLDREKAVKDAVNKLINYDSKE